MVSALKVPRRGAIKVPKEIGGDKEMKSKFVVVLVTLAVVTLIFTVTVSAQESEWKNMRERWEAEKGDLEGPDFIQPPKQYKTLEMMLVEAGMAEQPIIKGPPPQPVSGIREILVILVEFSDMAPDATHTVAYFDGRFFNTTPPSVRDYYTEVSYNTFTYVPGAVLGWYPSTYNQNQWVNIDPRPVVVEAIQDADPFFNFAPYDTNGDGIVTNEELTIFIIVSGNQGGAFHWWTVASVATADGVSIEGEFSATHEWRHIGSYCHELGHDLGLPDLYDTDATITGDSEGIGNYGLMGGGSWTFSHMTAWSKIQLGWIAPTIVTISGYFDVHDAETNAEAYVLVDPTHSTDEYFLVENRYPQNSYYETVGPPVAPSGTFPDEGILIYHVDEARVQDWINFGTNNVNVDETHKGVDVETAEHPTSHVVNADDLDAEVNRGDADDLWDINEYNFNDISIPCDATWYDGTPSGMDVTDFPLVSPTMSVYLSVNDSILKGLHWLRNHQNPDGSWQNSVGITSMAALAFLNAGHTEDNPTVNNAIQYILANQNADGSFGGGTYDTSAAVWALVATYNPDYNDEIEDAKNWLVDAQYDEGEGANPTDACYGGWRYGSSPGDGDLSNTQFALMALSAAGLPSGSDTWTKAITFTSRCQNRPASNDQAWAHDNTRPSYDDGGFIYHPTGWSLAGGSKSYGSMTAAGIWSLRLCGVDVPDGRVQDGLTWLTNNEDCSFDDNPVMGAGYQYYYYMSIAKALVMCFEDDLICADWYAALSSKLTDLQHDDGRWSHHLNDETTTDFALLALQTRQPPAADLWMSIILASNASLTVYDPQGRHARLGDVTIPGATFEIDAEGRQIVNLTELEAGKYRIELKGTADGNYSLTIEGYRDEEQTSSETFEGTIEEGEYQKSDVLVTSMVGALTIYVEKPKPLLVTDLPNVELVSADPTVTSINVTDLNLSEVNETYKPEECITPQSACMVNSTGAGNFTLKFTNIPNANIILVYKINATNQWIDLGATTTDDTVTFTMSVEDPPVVFCPGTLPASIRIEPETLNLASQGVFTTFIQLPEDYNVSDINVSTVVCEGAPAVRGMVSEEDNTTYIAKLNRQELVNVTTGDAVELTVTGNLYDGTPFEGSDTIRVIDKGKGK